MICAHTIRRLKLGTFDQFAEAFGPPPQTEAAGWVRFHLLRGLTDDNEVITFGFFDGAPDELERSQEEMGYRDRREAIEPLVDAVITNGIYGIVQTRTTDEPHLTSSDRRGGINPSREIFNPRTGQHMRFLLTAGDTNGELLRIETTNPPTSVAEPVHIHPKQVTRAELVAGKLGFVVDGQERRLEAGDAITIPAGVPHHFCNDGNEDAVAIQEARPALRTQQFFETYFELAQRGELDEHGKPSLLSFALLAPTFADEIRLVSPPWPVQRAAFTLLARIARRLGHTAAARQQRAGVAGAP
jgi:hypothetical protein